MASTLLEQVVREAPCLIVIFDPAFRSTFVNDYGRRLIGHAASERAFSLFDLFEPDDRQAIRDVAIPSLLREGLWEGEYVCRWSGEAGRGVEVKWTLFLLRSAGDEIVGVGCVAADLTHRRNVERRLRESRARLKMASDLVGLSSYQWDLRSGALQWDDRLKALWGLPPGVEPTMDLWEQGVHPDDRQLARAAAEQVLDPAGEGFCDIQYRVIGVQNGPERWVRTYGQTQFEDGEAVVFVGAILDITEQRRAGAQLQRSEDRFRRFAENTGDVLWILNSDAQTLEYLSPAFRSVYGLEPQTAMLDMGVWSDCVHPDDRPIRAEALSRVAEARDPITHEYRIVRPDGSVRKVQDTVFPIRDAEGRLSQIGGIAHDVSRRATVRVYIVDPEPREREARAAMLRKAGHEVTVFAAEDEFRSVAASLAAGCVLVRTDDGRADRFSLASAPGARNEDLLFIFETDLAGDIDLAILAMKSGAVDVLQAPAGDGPMLSAVASALANVRQSAFQERASQAASEQIRLMSRREREVLDGLLRGGTNKTMARELGISPRTVEIYRARVMERLGVHTVPEAVLAATAAGIRPAPRN